MIRTTWRDTIRGAHRALASRRFAASIVSSLALLALCASASAQSDAAGQDLGYLGLYLQSGSGHQQGPFTGTVNMNTLLGADRFYNAGFTGTNSVMANIEAGRVWNGHETLTHVTYIPNNAATSEF